MRTILQRCCATCIGTPNICGGGFSGDSRKRPERTQTCVGFRARNMHLFGFIGPPRGAYSFAEMLHYGRSVAGGSDPVASRADAPLPFAFWGAQSAFEAGVTVILTGEPLWRRGASPQLTGSDAARAVLKSYRENGKAVLERLAGRFSLAVIDEADHRALLAIDSMGIGRLSYASVGDGVVAGSSAEAVARFPGRNARIDHQSLADYLMLHMVPAPRTIFADVRKLRPAGCLVLERGSVSEQRYWNVQFEETTSAAFEPLRGELMESLRTAVKDCAPGYESGAFLSGGLDSSTVAGVMSMIGPQPTRTFTIGFGYPDYDETNYSRVANARFGCVGHEYVVTGDDIAAGLPLIAQAYDEPFGNSSALPVYFCSRLAREHGVTHLLAGDGGDELFAGNSRYAEQEVFERYRRVPPFVRLALIEPALRAWPECLAFRLVRKGRGYVEKASVPLPARLETWNLLHRLGHRSVMHEEMLRAIDPQATFGSMQELWDSAPAESTLNHMLFYDWQYTLSDNDLRKVETMSALAGVRVSYPMLHPAIVELSMRVPPQLKMSGARLRHFYKRAMAGFLPDEIINKKKHGFGLPFGLWLQESTRLREQVDDSLASLGSRRIIRPEFLDQLRHLHGQQDARYYGVFIWVLAMLEQWMQEHRISP